MSERSAAALAVPLHHLHTPERKAAIAFILGMRLHDLTALIAGDHANARPWSFTAEDNTGIESIDGVPCLVWSISDSAAGGEADALRLREAGIPHLHWHRASTVYGAAAAVFTGIGDPVLARCDDELQPVIGLIERGGRFVPDAQELAEANQFLAAKVHCVHSGKSNE